MILRKRLIDKAVRLRFAIHLPLNEGGFSGLLVESDQNYWVFDDCETLPKHDGDTPSAIPGRLWVKHSVSPAPYLQELR